jgi:dihydropteroate synthase
VKLDDLLDPRAWPERPLIAGIVNVTPDSFSDGGHFLRWEKAVEHGLRLLDEGADLLDVGGESTRPGSHGVDAADELERVRPVIAALAGETDAVLSIDTRKPEVAAAALEAGASWVNDVSAARTPGMLDLVASTGAGICLMHMAGEPRTMQRDPHYDDVVTEVRDFLGERARAAEEAGVPPSRIWIDPGIGFGKTLEHNLELMAGLDRLLALGYPLLLGASRKRFIAEISPGEVGERVGGSLAAVAAAETLRPIVVRVHDVRATRQFLEVRARLRRAHRARPEGESIG